MTEENYLDDSFLEGLTPLFQQYYSLKREHPDCLVLMQCGDFYEAYGKDAETFAKDLEIVQTAKEAGNGKKIAMAGVPLHTLDVYLRGLVSKGHRVAVAEQMADPSSCKGLVPRQVTRVVTAGTILDPQMLDEKAPNYAACLLVDKDVIGLAAADISTGDFRAAQLEADAERICDEVLRLAPAELLFVGLKRNAQAQQAAKKILEIKGELSTCEWNFNLSLKDCEESLCSQFHLGSLTGLDLGDRPAAVKACAALMKYLQTTSLKRNISLNQPRAYNTSSCMMLDLTTRRNLELTETLVGRERRGSLLDAIDRTCTSMGARKLRDWMLRPLCDLGAIAERHDLCEELTTHYGVVAQIRSTLGRVLDIERLLARASYSTANARDLLALKQSLQAVPELKQKLIALQPVTVLAQIMARLDPHQDLADLLEKSLSENPPMMLREGGMIRAGYSEKLDELQELRSSGREWISRLEEKERAATGIRTLKVGYTSVFGYYIEVTKANSAAVPDYYKRKQTLVNSERYIIPELKEYEAKILGADEQIKKLEYTLFVEVRDKTAAFAPSLRALADAIAQLDVFCSFADMACDKNWVRPQLSDKPLCEVIDSRHAVVEAARSEFVPNDCYLDEQKHLIILTGPNMSGKSTWLRQIAQLVILSQMGSFVPARSAQLSVVDRVFTRVGASDDLHLGQSTFMVEMSETANIVNNATPRSLVILDEIGRGTSTFDGLAIARAVIEYLHDGPHPLTLFATHFHELTKLGRTLPGCRNFRVAVKETPEEVIFLHKIVPGGADRSYGIYVAKLAGMPEALLSRAEMLLKRMENESKRRGSSKDAPAQSGLFDET